MPIATLPDGPVHYRVTGPTASADSADSSHPPVVFVHGLLVNGELWSGAAAALAERGIVSYAPDWPLGSHPAAMKPDADLTPRGIARTILAFLAALDLHDVTLVGNDTGGALCQFVIDTDHSRIGRLVLTNCDAFDQFPPPPFDTLVRVGKHPLLLRAMLPPLRLRAVRASSRGYGGLVRKPLDPELTRRWVQPCLTDAGVRHDTARFMGSIHKRELLDVSTRLGAFDKPVRLLWGAADRFFGIDLAHRLRDAFPQAQLTEIADARTFVPLDEPQRVADEVAAAVTAA